MSEVETKSEPAAPTVKADPALTRVDKEFKYAQPLFGCRFDPLGRYVFTGTRQPGAAWDLETGKATPLAGHESWVRAIACTPRTARP